MFARVVLRRRLFLLRYNSNGSKKTLRIRSFVTTAEKRRDLSIRSTIEMGEAQQPQPFEKMEEEGVPKCPQPTKVSTGSKKTGGEQGNEELPKLTPQEFRQFNHMSEHMDMFHENFRRTWNTLYTAASSNKRPQGMSIKQFLNTIQQFTHHLTIHHTIEEQHIFPVLAKRMDVFKADGGRHLEQHKGIHEGIERLEEYVDGVRGGERELELRELKRVMDSFGEVLWTHLDEEVRTLGAENMRRYWSLDEMRRMPM